MDTNTLVDIKYEQGKLLIEALDEEGEIVPIALWMNIPERGGWMLYLAVKNIQKRGARDVFTKINHAITLKKIDISLNDISLIDNQAELCKALRSMIRVGPQIGKVVFTNNFNNGRPFPDSVIYRVS